MSSTPAKPAEAALLAEMIEAIDPGSPEMVMVAMEHAQAYVSAVRPPSRGAFTPPAAWRLRRANRRETRGRISGTKTRRDQKGNVEQTYFCEAGGEVSVTLPGAGKRKYKQGAAASVSTTHDANGALTGVSGVLTSQLVAGQVGLLEDEGATPTSAAKPPRATRRP